MTTTTTTTITTPAMDTTCLTNTHHIAANEAQQTHLDEQGYLSLPLLDKAHIDALLALYHEHPYDAGAQGATFFNTLDQPKAHKYPTTARIEEIVAPVLGRHFKDFQITSASFVVKPTGAANFTPVHQDWTFVDERKYASYTLWCPLHDVDFSTSTLGVLPRSHTELQAQRPSPSPTYTPPFVDFSFELLAYLRYINLAAGEALLFNHRTWHGAGPRHADTPRIAIGIGLTHKNAQLHHHHVLPTQQQVGIFAVDRDFFFQYGPLQLLQLHQQGSLPTGYPCVQTYPFAQEKLQRSDIQALLDAQPEQEAAILDYLKAHAPVPHEVTNEAPTSSSSSSSSTEEAPVRTWWQIYTPKNMALEALFRVRKQVRKLQALRYVGKKKSKSKSNSKSNSKSTKYSTKHASKHAIKVGRFYDTYHDAFAQTYGTVIQALRTHNTEDLLHAQLQSLSLKPQDVVLDAGCGVGGVLAYFAQQVPCTFHGITISKKQYHTAKEHTQNRPNVQLHVGDFHALGQFFEPNTFDTVYFLESFGHADQQARVLAEVWNVLKPGGSVFIKDLFVRTAPPNVSQKKINRFVQHINQHYHYRVPKVDATLQHALQQGFLLDYLRRPNISAEAFENLNISNLFQDKAAVNQITQWDAYVFPVEFYELRLLKPNYEAQEEQDKYHLQRPNAS